VSTTRTTQIRFPVLYIPRGGKHPRVGFGVADLPNPLPRHVPVVVRQHAPAARMSTLDAAIHMMDNGFWAPARGGYPDFRTYRAHSLAALCAVDTRSVHDWRGKMEMVPFVARGMYTGIAYHTERLGIGVDTEDMSDELLASEAWAKVRPRLADHMVVDGLVMRRHSGPLLWAIRTKDRMAISLGSSWHVQMPGAHTFTVNQVDELEDTYGGPLPMMETYTIEPGYQASDLDNGYDPLTLAIEIQAANMLCITRRSRVSVFPHTKVAALAGLRRHLAALHPEGINLDTFDAGEIAGRKVSDIVGTDVFRLLPDLRTLLEDHDNINPAATENARKWVDVVRRRLSYRGRPVPGFHHAPAAEDDDVLAMTGAFR